jgi:hypothetical protein
VEGEQMRQAVTTEHLDFSNLLDFIEDIAENYGWSYERLALDEVILECSGSWCDYKLTCMWVEEMQTLGISVSFQMPIADKAKVLVYELLSRINEQMWMGHFDLSDAGSPTYRYTLLTKSIGNEGFNLVEDIIQIAISECERFFPAIQFALWGGKKPNEALASAMLETVGEA